MKRWSVSLLAVLLFTVTATGGVAQEIKTKDFSGWAEGAKSAPAVIALADQYQVEMPIARDVYRVVSGETNARGAYRGLLRTAAGS